jgi:creatinine amidohydrolase
MVYYQMIGYGQATPPKSLKVEEQRPNAHGGVYETSAMMAVRPGTVRMDQLLPAACHRKLGRLQELRDLGVYTAVNYYSNFPYHWAGPAEGASPEAGEEILDERARRLAAAARAIKADEVAPRLMREFLERTARGGTLEP